MAPTSYSEPLICSGRCKWKVVRNVKYVNILTSTTRLETGVRPLRRGAAQRYFKMKRGWEKRELRHTGTVEEVEETSLSADEARSAGIELLRFPKPVDKSSPWTTQMSTVRR
jgi:hypothetical protein